MPATSEKQQRAMCMAYAARKGKLKVSELKGAALEIYKSDMTDTEIKDFTVRETVSLKDYLNNQIFEALKVVDDDPEDVEDIENYINIEICTDKGEPYDEIGMVRLDDIVKDRAELLDKRWLQQIYREFRKHIDKPVDFDGEKTNVELDVQYQATSGDGWITFAVIGPGGKIRFWDPRVLNSYLDDEIKNPFIKK